MKGFGGQQDYGRRVYDTRIGRFLSVDPLQAQYPELTPYQFAHNSPIDGIDLDGLERMDYRLTKTDQGTQLVHISTGPSSVRKSENFWRLTTIPPHVRLEYNGQHYLFSAGNTGYRKDFLTPVYYMSELHAFVANPDEESFISQEDAHKEFVGELAVRTAYGLASEAGNRMGYLSARRITGSRSTNSSTNQQAEAATGTPEVVASNAAGTTVNNQASAGSVVRPPTPIESERELTPRGAGEVAQPVFKSGKIVSSATKGSVKPESYNFITAVGTEVKNFTFKPDGVSPSSLGKLVKQIRQRQSHLPAGSTQHVILDIRGQNVPLIMQLKFRNDLLSQTRTPGVTVTFQQ